MNKRIAKKLLSEQKEKLEDIANHNDQWILQTRGTIERIFGRDSNEYNYFTKFSFSIPYIPGQPRSEKAGMLLGKIIEARRFLENCITTIDLLNFKNESSQNILSDLNPVQFWASILSVGLVVFGAGLSIGKYMSDVQNVEIRQQVKTLSDSLAMRPLPNIISSSDSTQEAQDQHKKVK